MSLVERPSTRVRVPTHLFGYARKLESVGCVVQYTSKVRKEPFQNKETLTAFHPKGAKFRMRVSWNPEATVGHVQFTGMMPRDDSGRWRNIVDEEDFWLFVLDQDEELLVPHTCEPEGKPKKVSLKQLVCKCQKVRFTEEGARQALVNAKIKRYLHHDRRRREERSYECPGKPGVFHLTSQKYFYAKGAQSETA